MVPTATWSIDAEKVGATDVSAATVAPLGIPLPLTSWPTAKVPKLVRATRVSPMTLPAAVVFTGTPKVVKLPAGIPTRALLTVTLAEPVTVAAMRTGVVVSLFRVIPTPGVIAAMTEPAVMPVPLTGMPTKNSAVEPV